MLKSEAKGWFYVGSTNRLKKRVIEHNKGLVRSTKSYCPLKLVFTKEFILEKEARDYEKRIKRKRIEKEEIIRQIKEA